MSTARANKKKSRAVNTGGLMSTKVYIIIKKGKYFPTHTIPLRQTWPDDMVLVIIPNSHI